VVHAHADALSFELAAHGRTLLVDPGTFTYTGSKELRDWFRGSTAHNTLTIDGEWSSLPNDTFSWKTTAGAVNRSWITHRRFDYVAGEHSGYARLTNPGKHTRTLLFLKKDYWVMQDCVDASENHSFDLWFHFAPESQPRLATPTRIQEKHLNIASFAKNGSWQQEDGSVSHCYAERTPAPVYRFTVTASAADVVTFMLPVTAVETPPEPREVEALVGRGFELVSESWHDVVMMRRAQQLEMATFVSDFEYAWVRFSKDDLLVPQELVLIDGNRLELNGRVIVSSKRKIN